MESHNINAAQLGHTTGILPSRIVLLLNGKADFRVDVAIWLSQAFPQFPPEFWVQAQALHDLDQNRPLVERRTIKPIEVMPPDPLDDDTCMCGHYLADHNWRCLITGCSCALYLRAISVAAYLELLPKDD